MELSWIQRHALMVLLRCEAARVKDMTPPGVAANLFSYHLDGLVMAKLIEKSARGTYRLTSLGQKFSGKFSTATNRMSEEIKTVVMLYAKCGDKYLLFRWSRQPYLGKLTPLYDRMPLGKSLEDGIHSALGDKLGRIQPVSHKGSAIIKIMTGETLISHMNALLYGVDMNGTMLPHDSRNGQAALIHLDDPDVMEGVSDFIVRVSKGIYPIETTWRY